MNKPFLLLLDAEKKLQFHTALPPEQRSASYERVLEQAIPSLITKNDDTNFKMLQPLKQYYDLQHRLLNALGPENLVPNDIDATLDMFSFLPPTSN